MATSENRDENVELESCDEGETESVLSESGFEDLICKYITLKFCFVYVVWFVLDFGVFW